MRCRSMFYTSLGRLLMVDLGEDEEKFDAFMAPLTQAFENLGSVLLNSNSNCNTEEVNISCLDTFFDQFWQVSTFLEDSMDFFMGLRA